MPDSWICSGGESPVPPTAQYWNSAASGRNLISEGTPADFRNAGVGFLLPIVFGNDSGIESRRVTSKGLPTYTSVEFLGVGNLIFIGSELPINRRRDDHCTCRVNSESD